MSLADLMPLLQAQLDKLSLDPTRTAQLQHLLNVAIQLISREGVHLVEPFSAEDAQLIIMYAAYLFEKRSTNEPMPRMLRFALNNRIISEVANRES